MSVIKSIYRTVTTCDDETRAVIRLVHSCAPGSHDVRVLDVGCGNGRFLGPLGTDGYDVTGVDANRTIVDSNRKSGFRCMLPEELPKESPEFNILIMSHVIEHFGPTELLAFMDSYLDRLKPGGHLVIATPLMSPYFYLDFDHAKPYHPVGIDMVFGPDAAQVQYCSRNVIRLKDIWFRRSPYRIDFHRARYIRTWATRALQTVDFLLALLYIGSFHAIGRTDGWVGTFQKLPSVRNPARSDNGL